MPTDIYRHLDFTTTGIIPTIAMGVSSLERHNTVVYTMLRPEVQYEASERSSRFPVSEPSPPPYPPPLKGELHTMGEAGHPGTHRCFRSPLRGATGFSGRNIATAG